MQPDSPNYLPTASPASIETVGQYSRNTGKKATRAIIEWLSHCFIVAALLGGMRLLQVWTEWLWNGEPVLLLGLVPLEELFKTADFILLSAVLVLGIGCVVRAYKGQL